jgi:SAF domain
MRSDYPARQEQGTGPMTDKPSASVFLLLHPRDNVLISAGDAFADTIIAIDGRHYTLGQDIALGHKIARATLRPGEQVYRSGFPIGTVTQDIAIAEHVHAHNLTSNYLRAHDRASSSHEGFGS